MSAFGLPARRPASLRLRPSYDAGVRAHQEGMDYDRVHRHIAEAYKTRERRRAFLDGWVDADRRAEWAKLPDCPVCHQPCVPPESEEERRGLDQDHPWHPDNGRKLPHG